MQAPLDTIQHERAGRGPKASRAIAPSCAHQREASDSAPLSRGHHVHVVSNQPKKGFSTVTPLPAVLTLPLVPDNWRRFARRPFPIHVSARGILLPRLSRKRVCSIPLGHTRAYSATVSACQPSVRNRLPHQRFVDHTADRLHHLSALSYAPSFDGSKKPWKWRQELGKIIQGRGCFVQGGGCCD